MRKILLCLSVLLTLQTFANPPSKPISSEMISFCSGGSEYESYYNLFMQEIIDSPRYYPFLLAYEVAYYSPQDTAVETNENIEEWQEYLGLNYEQTYYLVFNASETDVRSLSKDKTVADKKLAFADANFRKNHKQALLYLAYAKYLEPYMTVSSAGGYENYWGNSASTTVNDLDYNKVINVLERSYRAETDNELKLRYGYQLVRMAHYGLKFKDAVEYFHNYVEPLNYKPVMYYYALDQKGGAERALGNYMQANSDFFQFFAHTKNRKDQAYSSMKATQNLNFEKLLREAKTDGERNDLFLLMGYRNFNNPIEAMKSILKNNPDAIQAKVLMARAINQLEREILSYYYECPYNDPDCGSRRGDYRLPIFSNPKTKAFLAQTLATSLQQSKNASVRDKDFWFLTTSYLNFLQKEYALSRENLSKVTSSNADYRDHKERLETLLTITEAPKITPQFEARLMGEFKDYLTGEYSKELYYGQASTTKNFILDILANRFYLQGDYAKSFLLQNKITALESNPNLELLKEIETLYNKKNKNAFEKHLIENMVPWSYDHDNRKSIPVKAFDFNSYAANMRGNVLLAQGKFGPALEQFNKVESNFKLFVPKYGNYDGYNNVPSTVFGYNRIECFNCPVSQVMKTDYLADFPLIKTSLNKKELANVLVNLQKEAKGTNEKAAKANYLIGNFMYNTGLIGYYREILTFDGDNSFGPKFHSISSQATPLSKNAFFLKHYGWDVNYSTDFELPLTYFQTALKTTKDAELKARLLFAASKCEQGLFYQNEYSDPDFVALNNLWEKNNIDYKEFEKRFYQLKRKKYRTYFQQLSALSNTHFFGEVRSNCMFFNTYLN
ncbi:MAG: hypothetical protein WBA61_10665 [Aequorivita sp.]